MPGSHQGWNPATAPVLKETVNFRRRFVILLEAILVTSHPDWNHTVRSMGSLDTSAAGNWRYLRKAIITCG